MDQGDEELLNKITLGSGMTAMQDLFNSGSTPQSSAAFQAEAQRLLDVLTDRSAFLLSDFLGPYDLKLGFAVDEQALTLKFNSSSNKQQTAKFKIPFASCIEGIKSDREALVDRVVFYRSVDGDPNVVRAMEEGYVAGHESDASKLQERFESVGISGCSRDFLKNMYALLRFTVPVSPEDDANYARYYMSLRGEQPG